MRRQACASPGRTAPPGACGSWSGARRARAPTGSTRALAAAFILAVVFAARGSSAGVVLNSGAQQYFDYGSDSSTSAGNNVGGITHAVAYSLGGGGSSAALYAGGAVVTPTTNTPGLSWTFSSDSSQAALPSSGTAKGGADALLVRLNLTGKPDWSLAFGTADDDWISDVAAAPLNVALNGVYAGVVAVGVVAGSQYPVTSFVTGASSTVALSASFDSTKNAPAGFVVLVGPNSAPQWARLVGGNGASVSFAAPNAPPTNTPWAFYEPFPSRTGWAGGDSQRLYPYQSDGAFGVAVSKGGEVFAAAQIGPSAVYFCDAGYNMRGLTTSTVNAIQDNSRSGFDGFLGKWNGAGTLIWHLRIYGTGGTKSHDGAFGVAVSPTDNGAAVVGTSLSSALAFQQVQPAQGIVQAGSLAQATATNSSMVLGLLYNGATSAGYVARTDIAGTLQWAVGLLGDAGSAAYGVAIDALNAVYVCGTFGYQLRVQITGSTTQPSTAVLATSSTGFSGFVVKFNSNGAPVWFALAGGGAPGDAVWRVTTDVNNDAFIFGVITSKSANLGNGELLNNAGATGYAAKLSSAGTNGAGTVQWNATVGSPSTTRVVAAGAVSDTGTVFWGGALTQASSATGVLTSQCGNTTTVSLQTSARSMPFVGAFSGAVSCGGNQLSGGGGVVIPGGDSSSSVNSPPWVVAVPSSVAGSIQAAPRAVALSADGATVFGGGWAQSNSGASVSVYSVNSSVPTTPVKLSVTSSSTRTDALIFAVAADGGTPLWSVSFGGTGDDAVLDLDAASQAGQSLVYAGGRFGGGTVTLSGASQNGASVNQVLSSADGANVPTPAGFLAVLNGANGGVYSAVAIGGNGSTGATFTYGSSDNSSLVNTPFATMFSKPIDGVNGVSAGVIAGLNNVLTSVVYVAATLGLDAPAFCTDETICSGVGSFTFSRFALRIAQSSIRTTDAYIAQFVVKSDSTLSLWEGGGWLMAIGGSGAGDHDAALGVAAAGSDGVVAVGASTSTVVTAQLSGFETAPLGFRKLQGSVFGWAMKISVTGSPVWGVSFSASTASAVYGAAVDGSMNALVVGSYNGAMTIVPVGTQTLPGGVTDAPATNGATNAFITKLSSAGTAMWTTWLTGSGNDLFARVALDSTYDAYVFGSFSSQKLLSSDSHINLTSAGGRDGIAARFTGSSGAAQWALGVQSSGDDAAYGGAVQGTQSGGGIYIAGLSSTLSNSVAAVALSTTCSSPVYIAGVFSLGWLAQSPLRSDVCPYVNYTNGGGYNNTGGPKQTLPPAGPGQAVYNIPLAFSVSDPSSFDGMAAEAALAATLGINASNVIITDGYAMMSFTMSFSGATSLPTTVQNSIASDIAGAFSIPNASAVTFAAPQLSGRRRALLQTTSGSVQITAGSIPKEAFSLLSLLNSSIMASNLSPRLTNAGLSIGTVTAPAFTLQVFFSILATSNPTASLTTATASGALLTALIQAGLPISGVAVTSAPTPCAPSPCSIGATCAVLGGAPVCSCPAGTYDDGSTCAACGALPPPTVTLGFSSPINRGTAASFFSTVNLPTTANGGTCSLGTGFTYAWTVLDGTGASAGTGSGQTLSVAAGTLGVGASASVSLRLCYVNSSAACATATVPFAVTVTPLVAAVSGGGSITAGAAASLDASKSVDPDAPTAGGLTYAWSCVLAAGGPCVGASGATLSFPATSQLSLAALPGAASPGLSYNFTVTVAKDVRTASAFAAVTALSDGASRALVKINALPQSSVNPSARTVVSATVTPAAATDSVALQWSVAPSSSASINLTDPAKVSTPLSFASIVFLPDALSGSEVYIFRLTATSTSASGAVTSSYGEIVVPTTVAYPVPGTLTVSPNTGVVALATDVTLTASGWTIPSGTAADLPIQYSFAYQINSAGGTAPSADAPVTVLTSFKPLTSTTVRLPAGTLRLLVFAQSARGATTLLSSVLPAAVVLTVASPAGLEADYAPPIVVGAVAAAAAGQIENALQLAGGLAAIFNAAPSNDTLRVNNRADLLFAVGTATVQAPPTTPSALSVVADALGALTTVPAELSSAGRGAAVAVLGSVASAGTLVSRPTAATVLFSLSNVSVSGVSAIVASSNASSALPDLKGILSAVGSLASSLQAGLSVPGEAPITLQSLEIKTSVALDLTSNASRLFNAPITAPGAGGATFSALPAGALPASAGAAVNTSFHYMTFDPHSGAVNNGTGSARLLFGSGGSTVEVAGLATPITITLPALGTLASPSLFGQCTFWNTAQQVYTTDGCVGLPNPLPPGLTASFNATAAASGAAGAVELAASVTLSPPSSPLLAGCSVGVLDCAALGASAVFFLNPDDPFSAPAVRCPALSSLAVGPGGTYASVAPALRVYYGATCQLWNTSNAERCYWNATAQAFAGTGCVPASGPEQCLCRHLTDFSSFAFPQIRIATPDQMVAISPKDIITKLRFFLCVICVLFGVMHIGAFIGAALDAAGKKRVLKALLSDAFAYEELPGGVWTWSLYQQPVVSDFGAVAGPLVDLAGVIGLPFARLRCAVPEELLGGDVAHMVGRAAGLSVAACTADAAGHAAHQAEMFGGGGGIFAGCCSPGPRGVMPGTSKQLAATDDEPDTEAQKEAVRVLAATESARVTSSALMFALIWTRMLLPREEIAERQAAAAEHFSRERTSAGSFDALVARFKDLLAGGNLCVTEKWMDKARLWRIILLHNAEGYWDPTPGLAFALQATTAQPGASHGRPTLWQAMSRKLSAFISGEPDAKPDVEEDEGAGSPPGSPASPGSPGTPEALRDDPLHFSMAGALASMPHALRAATAEPAERVWVTLLCMALLEGMENCYIVNGVASKEMEEEEVTMVDQAESWLTGVASRDADVAAALPGARVRAARMTREWALAQEERIAALRRFELSGQHRSAQQVSRVVGEVVRAAQTKHETFSTFLGPPQDGLQRWQKWCMMLTVIIGGLTVETWFFYSKGVTCCGQLRELVGCSADPGVPCRGFTNDCADLQAQFQELPPQVLPPGADVAGFTCHAFPDDDNPVDKFFVGLIFAAVAIPLRYILQVMLEMSNEAEHAEAWVTLSRKDRLLARLLCLGPFSWHYADPERRPNILLRLYARWAVEPFNMAIDALIDFITKVVLACARLCGCGCGCVRRQEMEAEAEGNESGGHARTSSEGAAAAGNEGAAAEAPARGIRASASAPVARGSRGSFAPTRTGTVRMVRTSRIIRLSGVTRPIFAETAAGWDPNAAAAPDAKASGEVVETEEEIREAMEEEFENAVKARVVGAVGMTGIYLAWGIFTWCVAVCAAALNNSSSDVALWQRLTPAMCCLMPRVSRVQVHLRVWPPDIRPAGQVRREQLRHVLACCAGRGQRQPVARHPERGAARRRAAAAFRPYVAAARRAVAGRARGPFERRRHAAGWRGGVARAPPACAPALLRLRGGRVSAALSKQFCNVTLSVLSALCASAHGEKAERGRASSRVAEGPGLKPRHARQDRHAPPPQRRGVYPRPAARLRRRGVRPPVCTPIRRFALATPPARAPHRRPCASPWRRRMSRSAQSRSSRRPRRRRHPAASTRAKRYVRQPAMLSAHPRAPRLAARLRA